jgi:hypothetical protein
MKKNPSNPADINTEEVRDVSPKAFERARVLDVDGDTDGAHTATIKLYDSGSQTVAPILTSAFGDVSLPAEDTDVIVMFGENDQELIIGSWYPPDRVVRGQITLPDYNAGDRVVGNGSGSVVRIYDDGTIDLTTEGTKPLNTDHQSASAYLDSAQTITANSEQRVEFNAVSHNSEGLYDTSTYETVLLNDGEYEIKSTVEIAAAGQGNTYTLRIYHNSTVIKRSYRQSSVDDPLTLRVSTNAILSAGDSIYVTLENGSNKDRTLNGDDIGTEFDIRRIGPAK